MEENRYNPKISIIVPSYNQGEYLSETLQSVLDQSYNDWECIIVNDGSTDDTDAIAKKWCSKDPRFIYIKQPNGGVCKARNEGITRALGEWILPLDGDDKIGKDYLKLAFEVITNRPHVGLIYANACFFGNIEGKWELAEYNFERILLFNHIYCSAIYKKEDWIYVGGYDINMKDGFEDWEFWINLLSKTKKEVVKLDYIGFFYRRRDGSRDHVVNEDKNKIRDIELYVYEKHKKLYTEYYGTPQEIIHQKNLNDTRLQYFDNRMLKIRSNFFTRVLNAIINLLI